MVENSYEFQHSRKSYKDCGSWEYSFQYRYLFIFLFFYRRGFLVTESVKIVSSMTKIYKKQLF